MSSHETLAEVRFRLFCITASVNQRWCCCLRRREKHNFYCQAVYDIGFVFKHCPHLVLDFNKSVLNVVFRGPQKRSTALLLSSRTFGINMRS
eukprot:s4087_g8.t1